MATTLDSIIARLNYLVDNPAQLPTGVPEIQKIIWESQSEPSEDRRWEILRDLAYDLDYYDSNSATRAKENWLIGEEGALEKIREALSKMIRGGNGV